MWRTLLTQCAKLHFGMQRARNCQFRRKGTARKFTFEPFCFLDYLDLNQNAKSLNAQWKATLRPVKVVFLALQISLGASLFYFFCSFFFCWFFRDLFFWFFYNFSVNLDLINGVWNKQNSIEAFNWCMRDKRFFCINQGLMIFKERFCTMHYV